MATNLRTVICLLRNDLRFHDNEVLHWANRNSTHILPLYCFDPKQFLGTPNFNFPMTGPFQMKLLLQTIADLRSTLRSKGSDLIVRHGKPEVVINDLIKTLGADNVHAVSFHEEVTRDEPLEVTLRKESQIKVQTFWGHTLYHKDDLSFSPKQLPDVYTQFRKKVEGQSSVRKCLVMPEKLNPLPGNIESGDIPSAEQLGGQECSFDERGVLEFRGGESVALERLNHYLFDSDNVATYKETRNGLIGADYSTKFSIWLAFGSLSPRHIFWEVKRYESERVANQSTYWVIFELIWRDYFRFVALKYGDQIFKLEGIHGKNIPWKQDQALFTAWKEGRTGVPFVDANMRELAATGFMSNRGRQKMKPACHAQILQDLHRGSWNLRVTFWFHFPRTLTNVASFLTKDLKLDWRMGAEWFESMLVDHDISSNYGNWLYSAGIGNDPREDRKFNMVKQGLDYDPNGDYIRLWIPELANVKGGAVHTVWTLSNSVLRNAGISLGETYPNPIVIAPEWQRHIGKTTGSARGGRHSGGSQPRQNRGIDFYFKGQGSDKHH